MKPMRFFLDTHDRSRNTFPAKLTPQEFEVFFAKYEKACCDEGVVPVRLYARTSAAPDTFGNVNGGCRNRMTGPSEGPFLIFRRTGLI
jgi:hypothetical protein